MSLRSCTPSPPLSSTPSGALGSGLTRLQQELPGSVNWRETEKTSRIRGERDENTRKGAEDKGKLQETGNTPVPSSFLWFLFLLFCLCHIKHCVLVQISFVTDVLEPNLSVASGDSGEGCLVVWLGFSPEPHFRWRGSLGIWHALACGSLPAPPNSAPTPAGPTSFTSPGLPPAWQLPFFMKGACPRP